MAANRTRNTVDLNAYRNSAVVRGSAAPKTRPRPAPQTKPAPRPKVVKKSQKQLRQEAQRSRALGIKIVTIATVLFLMIGFQIYSHVKVDELDQQLNDINQQIAVLESDNTRRNMELNASVSLDKVDEYARNELGMVKVSDYQVHYVTLTDGDTVEVSGGKSHQSLAQKLKIKTEK